MKLHNIFFLRTCVNISVSEGNSQRTLSWKSSSDHYEENAYSSHGTSEWEVLSKLDRYRVPVSLATAASCLCLSQTKWSIKGTIAATQGVTNLTGIGTDTPALDIRTVTCVPNITFEYKLSSFSFAAWPKFPIFCFHSCEAILGSGEKPRISEGDRHAKMAYIYFHLIALSVFALEHLFIVRTPYQSVVQITTVIKILLESTPMGYPTYTYNSRTPFERWIFLPAD